MSIEIKKGTDIDDVRERLGVGEDEEIRASRRRETHLQKFARIIAMDPGLSLRLHPTAAHIELNRDTPLIRIPTMELPQEYTSYPRNVYDLLVQETLTLHEVGHFLYSDWPSLKLGLEQYDEEKQPVMKTVWNAIEDGVIEGELMRTLNCIEEFGILHANLAEVGQFGNTGTDIDGTEKTLFTMTDAVVTALMDIGYYDSGTLNAILDPNEADIGLVSEADHDRFEAFLPEIEAVIADAHAEPDAASRNGRIFKFCDLLDPLLDESDFSGVRDQGKKDHASPMDGLPDDAQEGIGEARQDLGTAPSPGDSSAAVEERVVAVSSGETNDGQDAPVSTADGDDGEEDGDPGGVEAFDDEVAESYEEGLRSEVDALDDGEAYMAEVDKFLQVFNTPGGPGNGDSVHLPDPVDGRSDIWRRGRGLADRLAPIYHNRLRMAKRDRRRQNQHRGQLHLDNTTMIKAARGNTNIFSRRERGRQKDYSAFIVLDRSGSMSGSADDIEVATVGTSMALDRVGVDNCVMDIYGGNLRLLKPFGADPETAQGVLTEGITGGGTPLTEAIRVARERIRLGAGTHPFIVVITDGEAHHTGSYKRELNQCQFPVLGVYLAPNVTRGSDRFDRLSSSMEGFHYWTIITEDDHVEWALSDMVQRLML